MANIVDPDQTALKEQSDLGLHCLPVCSNIRTLYRAPDKRGYEDNSEMIFLNFQQNICCDPSLELSQ